MDMDKNVIPENARKIHLTAVCGSAMGALACLLKDTGHEVTGSDSHVYPPMSTFLIEKGIKIIDGFAAENISYGPDLVIIGNAISRDNPEAVAADEMGLAFCSMPQAVNHFAGMGKQTLLVAGTHGKTTTSSILAWLLYSAGLDPTYMIGGILNNFGSNFRAGNGGYMVVEGDEYDTAFFDKGPKFMHYDPAVSILTSVEFDHADIYRDLDHVKEAFSNYTAKLKKESLLLTYDAGDNIDDVVKDCKSRIASYGLMNDSAWKLGDISIEPPWSRFTISNNDEKFEFKAKLMGEHNLLNAASAIATAFDIGISPSAIATGLETFEGVKRRQEIRGVKNSITVMDDFAHHPTAVRETIRAVKPFFSKGRLIAVFEPRTNSSMRDVFQEIYPQSFDGADIVLIRKPSLLKKVPEGQRFSSEKLAQDLQKKGMTAICFPDTDAIIEKVKAEAKPGDLVMVMSNGGFDNIHERLLDVL